MTEKDLIKKRALEIHEEFKGKITVEVPNGITDNDIKYVYSPGVAEPCLEIKKDRDNLFKYTVKSHMVGIITNGTAVLGLGDIGADASLPVMEGKAMLLKRYVGVDAFPLPIEEKDPDKFIEIVKKVSSVFGAINLEDISSPNCVYIEKRLQEEMDIPVFHDDQHGTAIAALSGLINIQKIIGKDITDEKVVICGVGAAGSAIIKSLNAYGFKNIYAVDRNGTLIDEDKSVNPVFHELIEEKFIQTTDARLSLADALKDAKIFIGVSAANILSNEMVASMKKDPIIFALANPTPEISVERAKEMNVRFYASGAHMKHNQINNFLAFPGVLKGMIASQRNITPNLKVKIAEKIASFVTIKELEQNIFVPKPNANGLHESVAGVFLNEK